MVMRRRHDEFGPWKKGLWLGSAIDWKSEPHCLGSLAAFKLSGVGHDDSSTYLVGLLSYNGCILKH